MTRSNFQTVSLGIAGLTALAVGLSILLAPQAFYESYGTRIGNDANLLSDLRATSATLFVLGTLMLAGLRFRSWRQQAGYLATAVFLAFPAGRALGLVIDGMPSEIVLTALGLELFIGLLCLAAFISRPEAGDMTQT